MSIYVSINCSNCGSKLKERDHVVIDFINTLYHKECYKGSEDLIRGVGTYRQICEEFPYFYKDKNMLT